MSNSIESSLQYIRAATSNRKNVNPKKKKEQKQTVKEYLIMRYGPVCAYCRNKYKTDELCLIKRVHNIPEGALFEPKNNKIIACKECASLKSNMDHDEFLEKVKSENLRKRQEIVDNYPEISTRVFTKYKNKCIYCEYEFGFTPEERSKMLNLDHKKAISRNGGNQEKNIASACVPHKKEKKDMTTQEYFAFLESKNRKYGITKS